MLVGYGINGIKRLYEQHSVACTGMKGSGKDMLTANVVLRRKVPYMSNIDYTHDDRYISFDPDIMRVHNSWKNLLYNRVNKYVCPLPNGCDVYISDAGVYFPSQYCNELNKEFPDIPTFLQTQRHLNQGKTHYNTQNVNRVWDKIREHCDVYIYCRFCKVLFGKIVLQLVTVYDKLDSCQARVKVPRVPTHGLVPSREASTQRDIYLDDFYNKHGRVKNRLLIYWNKSKYDTHHFNKLFGGSNNEN